MATSETSTFETPSGEGLRWWHALIGVGVLGVSLAFGAGLGLVAAGGGGADDAGVGSSGAVSSWVPLAQFGLMALLALGVLRWSQRGSQGQLARCSGPVLLGVGALAGVVFALAWQLLILATDGQEASRTVTAQLGVGRSVIADVVLILTVAAVGPFAEELVFRGLVFRGVRDWLAPSGARTTTWIGVSVGSAVSAVLFAASHTAAGQSEQFLPLAFLGLVACALYQVTGSLATAVVFHSVSNSVGLAFMLFVQNGPGQAWHVAVIAAAPVVAVILVIATRLLGVRRA